jgi:hypothetical protein
VGDAAADAGGDRPAGFAKLEQRIDDWGMFSVVLARRR